MRNIITYARTVEEIILQLAELEICLYTNKLIALGLKHFRIKKKKKKLKSYKITMRNR